MSAAARARMLASWVRLEQTSGVGCETGRRLLAAFGGAEEIFAADLAALRRVVPDRVACALLAPSSNETRNQIEKTIAWAERPGNHLLTWADAAYPAALLNIPGPPLLLYVKGRLDLLSTAGVAVVGSRNASTQGTVNARKFSEALSESGLTVISGLALGIDAAAHEGGLCGPGSTVAVVGTGADLVYPARNRDLAHRIADRGCIVSEYPLGTPPISANFPRRNRIISGLARGVLVVEAAARSGSLITARLAADQGRDVFAIPGSIHAPLSKGCHLLIKEGAKLVETAQDVLEEMGGARDGGNVPPTTTAPNVRPDVDACAPLLATMGFDPVDVDSLALHCQSDTASINAQLLQLELNGQVERLPGGTYRRLS